MQSSSAPSSIEKKKVFKVEENGTIQYFKEYSYEETNRFHIASLNLWKDTNFESHNGKFQFLFNNKDESIASNNKKRKKSSLNSLDSIDFMSAIQECQKAAGELSQLLALTSELRTAEAIKVQSLNHFIPRAIKLPSEQCISIKSNGFQNASQFLKQSTSSLFDRVKNKQMITKQIIELSKLWQFASNISSSNSSVSDSGFNSSYLYVDCSYGRCGDDEDISVAYYVPLYAAPGTSSLQLAPEEIARNTRSSLVTLTWSLVCLSTQEVIATVSGWSRANTNANTIANTNDNKEKNPSLQSILSHLTKRRHDCFSRRLFHYLRNTLADILNSSSEMSTNSNYIDEATALRSTSATNAETNAAKSVLNNINASWTTSENLFRFGSGNQPSIDQNTKCTGAVPSSSTQTAMDMDIISTQADTFDTPFNKLIHISGDRNIPVFSYDQTGFSIGLCSDIVLKVSLSPIDSKEGSISDDEIMKSTHTDTHKFEQLLHQTRVIAENALLHYFHANVSVKKEANKLNQNNNENTVSGQNSGISSSDSSGNVNMTSTHAVNVSSISISNADTIFLLSTRYLKLNLMKESLLKLGQAVVTDVNQSLSLGLTAEVSDNPLSRGNQAELLYSELFMLSTVSSDIRLNISLANGDSVNVSRRLCDDTYTVSSTQKTSQQSTFSGHSSSIVVDMNGLIDAILTSILHCSLEQSITNALLINTKSKSKFTVKALTSSTLGIYNIHTVDELPIEVSNSLGSVSEADLQSLSVVVHTSRSQLYSDYYRKYIQSYFEKSTSQQLSTSHENGEGMISGPITLFVDFSDESRRNMFVQSEKKPTNPNTMTNFTVTVRSFEQTGTISSHSSINFYRAIVEYKAIAISSSSSSSSSKATGKRQRQNTAEVADTHAKFDLTAVLNHFSTALANFV